MTSLEIATWVGAAVLLFWTLGAYNRLVGLRNAIVQRFAPVDAGFIERHVLLQQLIDAVASLLTSAAERVEALRAACVQAETARAHARLHPGAPGAIKSLGLADDILAEARARLPVQSLGSLADLNARLAQADTSIAFARRGFNEAVLEYNRAVRQIPTRLIAAVFGFRPSGTL
jgi:LemA protein